MIGLALVTFIAVLANGMKQSNRRRDREAGEVVVHARVGERLRLDLAHAGDAIAKAPEVAVASNVRSGVGKASGSVQQITGLDPKTISQVYNFEWKDGSNRRSTISARTGRSSTRRSPTRRTSRWDRVSTS